MNQRIATKRIKRNILAKLWLRNFHDSSLAFLVYDNLLDPKVNLPDEQIELYMAAIKLTVDNMEQELQKAHFEASKKFYISKKLFVKIVYFNLKKLIR